MRHTPTTGNTAKNLYLKDYSHNRAASRQP